MRKTYKQYKIRKRATKYLYVALPFEWSQELDIKRGDILHFEGKGNELIIRLEKKEVPVPVPVPE